MDETTGQPLMEPTPRIEGPPEAMAPPPAITPPDAIAQPPNTLSGRTATPNALATPAASGSGRKKAGILSGGLAVLAILGAIAVKFVVPLLLGGAIVTAIGSVFGGPFDKLPSDVRQAFGARVEAVLPADFKQRTDAEQTAWIESSLRGGLPRLDDTVLVRRLSLETAALSRVDVATCAKFVTETPISDATSEKLVAQLQVAELQGWFDINIQAIEAEAAARAVPRVVADAEFDAVINVIVDAAPGEESTAMQAWFDGGTTDAVVCAGIRALLAGAGRLGAADLATAARYDNQP